MLAHERPDPMGSESEAATDDYCEEVNNVESFKTKHTTDADDIMNKDDKTYQASYDRWKINFKALLEDNEGRKKFYEFLETEQHSVLYECWHSCASYRQDEPKKDTAKEIYSRFVRIKDSRVSISDQARNNLALRLRANNITSLLLIEIENEVFANLRDIWYPKFIKSDFFTFYCETFGQAQYEPSNFHKFGKPSFVNLKHPLEDHQQNDHQSNDHNTQSCLTPYEKEQHHSHSECNSTVPSEQQSCDSHVRAGNFENLSMADTRYHCDIGAYKSHGHSKNIEHDDMPDLVNFKPRTQRVTQDKLKQMKPHEFAALLSKKLEKVRLEQTDQRYTQQNSYPPSLPGQPSSSHKSSSSQHHQYPSTNPPPQHYYHENYTAYTDLDVQSAILPPATDRYSVAGASSHSGSGANVEYQKHHRSHNVKEKAKGLFDAVHHSLRNGLGECNCPACCERRHNCLYGAEKVHSIPNHSHRSRIPNQMCCHSNNCSSCNTHVPYQTINDSRYPAMHPVYNNNNNNICQQVAYDQPYPLKEQLDIAPPVDTAKIYAWMERSEKYTAPSPSTTRRKKHAIGDSGHSGIAGQPIAQDPGMPLLPQPDTGNVLEEVKRVLEEPNQRKAMSKISRSNSSRSASSHNTRMKMIHPSSHHPPSHHPPSQHHNYSHESSTYSDFHYENNSMASVKTWNYSDNQSAVSYNPSQISTVPSSASRLWNEQGYYDPSYYDNRSSHDSHKLHHDSRIDTKSDARSHSSTGRKSTHSGMRMRSENRSTARQPASDVRSQSSTGRSQNSDHSRSRSKKDQGTSVTYYFGVEPIPYRIIINSPEVTLGKFKSEFRKGRYRFFFKVTSPDDGETVYEEFKDDDELLPFCNGRISGKVEKVE